MGNRIVALPSDTVVNISTDSDPVLENERTYGLQNTGQSLIFYFEAAIADPAPTRDEIVAQGNFVPPGQFTRDFRNDATTYLYMAAVHQPGRITLNEVAE